MTSEPNKPDETSVRVEVVPQSPPEPTKDTPTEGIEALIDEENKALIDALKKRAFVEAQKLGLNPENYLVAVRRAREALELEKDRQAPNPESQDRLVFNPENIERAVVTIQQEADKNFQSILREVADLGDRLSDAAKAAWDVLTAPRPRP
jgi:hypothetical protein